MGPPKIGVSENLAELVLCPYPPEAMPTCMQLLAEHKKHEALGSSGYKRTSCGLQGDFRTSALFPGTRETGVVLPVSYSSELAATASDSSLVTVDAIGQACTVRVAASSQGFGTLVPSAAASAMANLT